MFKRIIFVALVNVLFFASCQEEQFASGETPKDTTIAKPNQVLRAWNPDTVFIQQKINNFFTAHQVGDTVRTGSVPIVVSQMMIEMYRQRNGYPVWADESRIESLLKVLRSAEFDGLLPSDYYWVLLKQYQHDIQLRRINDSTFAKLDLMMTSCFLSYARDMWMGKVDPSKIYKEWNYEKRVVPEDAPVQLLSLLRTHVDSVPQRLRPHSRAYELMRRAFHRLDSLQKKGLPWPTITYPGYDLAKGDTMCTIIEAKIRFRNMGIYDGDTTSNLFSDNLVPVVKQFQRLVNVPQSGKLDKATIAKLNFTLDEVRNTLRVNMERCRWLLHDLPDYYVVVNIASYTLNVVDRGKSVYSTKVIVGREQTMTPVFQANLTQVIFNPDWTLPRSIIEKETLPALQKNPAYLSTHRMQLLKGDVVIDPSSINFKAYTAKTFPFNVKQLPGDDNALGKVKFIMPNPYSIYLHDTPSRYLFDKEERAFSHGCIRVYKPIDFSEFLLKSSGYNREWINKQLATSKTYAVSLSKKVPIMLTYWTCYEDRTTAGLQFFPDIYGRDGEILKELNKAKM